MITLFKIQAYFNYLKKSCIGFHNINLKDNRLAKRFFWLFIKVVKWNLFS